MPRKKKAEELEEPIEPTEEAPIDEVKEDFINELGETIHYVTEEDLELNPELVEQGTVVGDELNLGVVEEAPETSAAPEEPVEGEESTESTETSEKSTEESIPAEDAPAEEPVAPVEEAPVTPVVPDRPWWMDPLEYERRIKYGISIV